MVRRVALTALFFITMALMAAPYALVPVGD